VCSRWRRSSARGAPGRRGSRSSEKNLSPQLVVYVL
jgi:hypothetical protein